MYGQEVLLVEVEEEFEIQSEIDPPRRVAVLAKHRRARWSLELVNPPCERLTPPWSRLRLLGKRQQPAHDGAGLVHQLAPGAKSREPGALLARLQLPDKEFQLAWAPLIPLSCGYARRRLVLALPVILLEVDVCHPLPWRVEQRPYNAAPTSS